MALREIEDPLGAAITATEKEVAGHAWDQEDELVLDETGDRSVEQMGEGLEGQHEVEDEEGEEAEGDEAEGEETGETGKPPQVREPDANPPVQADPAQQPEGRVPPGRLREQTERAKAAEAERDALKAQVDNSRKENDDLKSRLDRIDGFLTGLQRQQPVQQPNAAPKPEVVPDMFENPTGYREYQARQVQDAAAQVERRNAERFVNYSMANARRFYQDKFDKAYDAITKLDPRDPRNQALVQDIWTSPDPGEAVVQWHQRNETLREVGDDPAKYRERIAAEARDALVKDPDFRKQLIEELRAEASGAQGGRPNNIIRPPRSLNGATGSATAREIDRLEFDDSDRAVADSAWR